MTPADLPALEPLAEGRNVHRSEYERFLRLEGARGLVLESEGGLVGAITLLRCFARAVVGPTLLAPGADGPGVSLALLGAAVEQLQRDGVVLAEAEAGEVEAPLLSAMGFRELRRTLVLERPASPLAGASTTRGMEMGDLLDVGALDADAVGYGRKEFLVALQDDVRVTDDRGEVTGFVATRRARRGRHLGPLVTRAGHEDAAHRLLRDAVATVAPSPVVTLVPEDGALLPALRELGFAPVGGLMRMRAGEAPPPAFSREWLVGSRLTG